MQPTEDIETAGTDDQHNAADPQSVNRARKKAARMRQRRVDFVRRMMDDPDGRLWVYDILSDAHIAGPTHTPGDPYSTAFKEGERNFANRVLADISEAAPDKYMVMINDGKNEK